MTLAGKIYLFQEWLFHTNCDRIFSGTRDGAWNVITEESHPALKASFNNRNFTHPFHSSLGRSNAINLSNNFPYHPPNNARSEKTFSNRNAADFGDGVSTKLWEKVTATIINFYSIAWSVHRARMWPLITRRGAFHTFVYRTGNN